MRRKERKEGKKNKIKEMDGNKSDETRMPWHMFFNTIQWTKSPTSVGVIPQSQVGDFVQTCF